MNRPLLMKPISVASIRPLDLVWLLLLIPAMVPALKDRDITVPCVLLLVIPSTMFGWFMYLRRQQTGLAVRLLKEAQSLMPAWLVTVIAPCVPFWFVDQESNLAYSGFLFMFGCAFMGALAFGNEYSHRTMGLLVAQPIARRRLWLEKMVVLGLGLLSALVVVELVVFSSERADWSAAWFLLVIPPLCALCAGPLLTFLTRNTLAAAVFTIAIPVTVFVGSMALPWFWRESPGVAADEDRLVARFLLLIALPIYCLAGGLLSYRKFLRLTVADSPTQSADPGLPVGAPLDWCLKKLLPANRGCLLNLTRKELRLHQLSFVLAGLFCLVWLPVLIVIAWRPDDGKNLAELVMALFVAILMTTVGAMTIAEERHLGLLDWHRTLPSGIGKQWLIKVAVALSLAAFLGLALPCLLGVATWGAEPVNQKLLVDPTGSLVMAGSILLLAGIGLYASSLCSNTLRAALAALGIAVGLSLVAGFATGLVRSHPQIVTGQVSDGELGEQTVVRLYALFTGVSVDVASYVQALRWVHRLPEVVLRAAPFLMLGVLLLFASYNYRRLRVGTFGLCLQLSIAALCAALLFGGIQSLELYGRAMMKRLAVERQRLEDRNRPAEAPPRRRNTPPRVP